MAARNPVAERLAVDPGRGLGCANEVAVEAAGSPEVLRELVGALGDSREVVAVRAANALKKVQAERPELVAAYAKKILKAAMGNESLLAGWSLTVVVGRLPLKGRDRALGVELMFEALRSESAFLRTFALTGLVEFAREDAALMRRVRPIVVEFMETGTAAMRARARKLMAEIRAS